MSATIAALKFRRALGGSSRSIRPNRIDHLEPSAAPTPPARSGRRRRHSGSPIHTAGSIASSGPIDYPVTL
jgi:hypothetical protein